MSLGRLRIPHDVSVAMRGAMINPHMMASIPAVLVISYVFGGENLLLSLAAVIPLGMMVARMFSTPSVQCGERDPLTGLPCGDTAVRYLEVLLGKRRRRRQVIVLAVALDESARNEPRLGPRVWDLVLAQVGDRILSTLRGGDQIVRLQGPAFGIVLPSLRRGETTDAINIADRIQRAIAKPIYTCGVRVHVTASIGVCFEDGRPADDAALFLAAAEAALESARVHGPASVAVFTDEMRTRLQAKSDLAETVSGALDSGQIVSWFQPQIDAETGRVTGLEALARWEHPRRGTLLPSDFLDPIEARGLGPRLFEVMLNSVCAQLRAWDRMGLRVPRVAVNIDAATLHDQLLAERLEWCLDSYDLTPDRISLEVLEDVVVSPDNDIITTNLRRVARTGCSVELDDFGTGQAALAGISRFGASRIKIDRSYVSGADADPQQRKMAEAIVNMARTLEIETIAEGVATQGEIALFSELGCDHLQGFGIARPMPAADVQGWMTQYHATRGLTPCGDDVALLVGETA